LTVGQNTFADQSSRERCFDTQAIGIIDLWDSSDHAEFTAPWCIFSQITGEDFGPLLEGAEHLVLYHYVVEGRLRAQIPNGEPIEIEAGEVLILPHNDGHLLGSHLDLSPVPAKQVVRVPP
jgi:hypothetical protein